VYLFDPYNSKHPEIKAFFKAFFSDKEKLIVGHTIEDDIGGIANFFELSRPVCKVIDIRGEYQKFQEINKQISLKAISKEILGKEICKKYTMTNWDRRPLNKCQIHYAAMDAFIIFKIWDKLSLLIEDKVKNP
jgi:ribonuclease D